MIKEIDQWCTSLFGNDIRVCAKPVADYTNALSSAELELVSSAVAIRQHTFSTGRLCAKTALTKLGVPASDYTDGLLRQDDGAVAWPSEVVGSISHTNDWAVSAVCKKSDSITSIGVDIELIDRVERDILKLIATDQEREEIESRLELRWLRVAVFSVKESIYKCLRPLYGEFIGFKEVQLNDLDTPARSHTSSAVVHGIPDVELFSPKVELLSPALTACCDQSRIEVRLAVLPKHVLSFVSYK